METFIELKKLYEKLQRDTLFTEETINNKVLKKLKSPNTTKTLNL